MTSLRMRHYAHDHKVRGPEVMVVVTDHADRTGAFGMPREIRREPIASCASFAEAARIAARLDGRPKVQWLHKPGSPEQTAYIQRQLDNAARVTLDALGSQA